MASFGGFTFTSDERPLRNTYSEWGKDPSYAELLPMGANRHDIVLMGVGSGRLSFDSWLTDDRFDAAQSLIGTVATFTGWDGTARQALCENVQSRRWVSGDFATGRTHYVTWALREV